MPPPIPVVLAEYDADWPHMAAQLAEQLKVLGPTLVEVHHIGSTSVPGLVAKPIIDLMPVVTNLADLDSKRGLVEQLGYAWHGEFGLSGRRYCTLSEESGRRIAQLHFFEAGTTQAERHLAFRDYLRANPESRRRICKGEIPRTGPAPTGLPCIYRREISMDSSRRVQGNRLVRGTSRSLVHATI